MPNLMKRINIVFMILLIFLINFLPVSVFATESTDPSYQEYREVVDLFFSVE